MMVVLKSLLEVKVSLREHLGSAKAGLTLAQGFPSRRISDIFWSAKSRGNHGVPDLSTKLTWKTIETCKTSCHIYSIYMRKNFNFQKHKKNKRLGLLCEIRKYRKQKQEEGNFMKLVLSFSHWGCNNIHACHRSNHRGGRQGVARQIAQRVQSHLQSKASLECQWWIGVQFQKIRVFKTRTNDKKDGTFTFSSVL